MSERQAFIDAILADPEDDTHRLVFADWLEEHDESERAEFIRLQIGFARRPQSYAFNTAARERELLEEHELDWVGGGPLIEAGWQANSTWVPDFEYTFARGFVATISCSTGVFLRHAKEVFAAHPIELAALPDGVRMQLGSEKWFIRENSLGFTDEEAWRSVRKHHGDYFDTEQDAVLALSKIAVPLGRRLATGKSKWNPALGPPNPPKPPDRREVG